MSALIPLPSIPSQTRNQQLSQRQALKNLEAVLEASGSSKRNVLKVNIFITTMDDFATMNEAYDEFFSFEPKPVSKVTANIVSVALMTPGPDLCCRQAAPIQHGC